MKTLTLVKNSNPADKIFISDDYKYELLSQEDFYSYLDTPDICNNIMAKCDEEMVKKIDDEYGIDGNNSSGIID